MATAAVEELRGFYFYFSISHFSPKEALAMGKVLPYAFPTRINFYLLLSGVGGWCEGITFIGQYMIAVLQAAMLDDGVERLKIVNLVGPGQYWWKTGYGKVLGGGGGGGGAGERDGERGRGGGRWLLSPPS